MSSINTNSKDIRKDENLKSDGKVCKKFEKSLSNIKTTQKTVKYCDRKPPECSKVNNKSVNSSKNAKSGVELESRVSLQQKIKFLEQELQNYDLERSRVTEELDRVCEEKDNQMRQMKSELHEKQMEINHQIYSLRKCRNDFEDRLTEKGFENQNLKIEFENKEKELNQTIDSLDKQLFELKDYIKNRDQTLAKIRQLEEIIEQMKAFHQKTKEKLLKDIENEKQKVEELVAQRVNEIQKSLEKSCLNKLSIDSRIALKKFEEMSKSYELCEQECRQLRGNNQLLKSKLQSQRIRTEVSESLLNEWLKEVNRKLHKRKDIGIQTNFND